MSYTNKDTPKPNGSLPKGYTCFCIERIILHIERIILHMEMIILHIERIILHIERIILQGYTIIPGAMDIVDNKTFENEDKTKWCITNKQYGKEDTVKWCFIILSLRSKLLSYRPT